MVLHAIHMCSGYGGFELGLKLAGVPSRTVAHIERDSHAAATLVARMDEKVMDLAPVWSDLSTFDPEPWVGRVDIITGGLPCQPFSIAGNQRGLEDERHLWPHAFRIISEIRPRFVLLENVPDVIRAGWLAHVLADLASIGFDAEWGMLRAADVGAPHQRERFWLLAYANGSRREGNGSVGVNEEHPGADLSGSLFGSLADTTSERRVEDGGHVGAAGAGSSGEQQAEHVDRIGVAVGNSVGSRRESVNGTSGANEELAEFGSSDIHVWPPSRDNADGWARYVAADGPEPAVRRSSDGRPSGLAESLHLGGNGLVPQVAAAAIVALSRRAGITLV